MGIEDDTIFREKIIRVLAGFPAAALGARIGWSSFKRRFQDQYKVNLSPLDLRGLDFIDIEDDPKRKTVQTIRWIEGEDVRMRAGLQPLLSQRSVLAPPRQITLKDWKYLYKALVRVISRRGQKLDDAPLDYPHAVFFCSLKPYLRDEIKAYDFDEHVWGFKKMRHLIDALLKWADSERIYTLILHKSEKHNDYMLCCVGPEEESLSNHDDVCSCCGDNEIERQIDPPEVTENMELRILVAELQKRLKIQVPEEMQRRDKEIKRLKIENAELKKRVAFAFPSFACGYGVMTQSIQPPPTDAPESQWQGYYMIPQPFYGPQPVNSCYDSYENSIMSRPSMGYASQAMMNMMNRVDVQPTCSTSSMGTSVTTSGFTSEYASSGQSVSMHSSLYHQMLLNDSFRYVPDDRSTIPQGIVEIQKANFDLY